MDEGEGWLEASGDVAVVPECDISVCVAVVHRTNVKWAVQVVAPGGALPKDGREGLAPWLASIGTGVNGMAGAACGTGPKFNC